MKKTFFLVLAFLFCAFGSGAAFAACYSEIEAEAEQGIRIHSELMVISLNCQHISARDSGNIYAAYREFTNDNAELFSKYEEILLNFFSRTFEGDPLPKLNELRTRFANKISNDAARMRPDMFCQTYMPRIDKAMKMSRNELRRWAATIFPSHPVSYPLCASTEEAQ